MRKTENSEMVTLAIELTKNEASYLASEMEGILRQFGLRPYNGQQFTNPDMASAFNKVYKALVGHDHNNCTPEHFEIVKRFHEEAIRNIK